MNHGLHDARCLIAADAAQLQALLTSYRQDRLRFTAHALHEQLRRLTRRCCRCLRDGDLQGARRETQGGLQALFPVRIETPQRPLALLAALQRRVQVDQARLCPSDAARLRLDLPGIDRQLQQLQNQYPLGVTLLEQRYFARLTLSDIALGEGAPLAFIRRELRFARAHLVAELRLSQL